MKLNEHIEDIVEMYLKGKSCPEISKKFNCTSNAILYNGAQNPFISFAVDGM